MEIELPPDYLKNLLIIDNLLQSSSIETIIKYFHLAGSTVTDLIKCNVRFCSLLKKYLCSMEQRKNIRLLFGEQKSLEKTMANNNYYCYLHERNNHRMVKDVMNCDQELDLHNQEEIEMYATMQMSNIRQQFFAASFDVLLHISIPCSAQNFKMDRRKISFLPNSTFLIESIDFEISITKLSKKKLFLTLHEKPLIVWSKYGRPTVDRESICTNITTISHGLSATNASLDKSAIYCGENNFPIKQYCKEWQGNFLIAIVLFCHREFKNESR